MYKTTRKGLRCQICTGCGLCPGAAPEGDLCGDDSVVAPEGDLCGDDSVMTPEGDLCGVDFRVTPEGDLCGDGFGTRSEGILSGGHMGTIPESDRPGGIRILTEDALRGTRRPFPRNGKRLAVADIGTTTIAMLLYDVDGSVAERFMEVNPQAEYGADVLSRIRAAEEPAAASRMRESIRNVLGKGLKRFRKKLSAEEELYLVIAANTTMTYLFLGWDTAELGRAPFAASRLSGAQTELGGARCFVLPGFSAFVGGDILAGCEACGMAQREEITLLIDLGTNGELLLGNRQGRIACATAAGPAFEGGASRGIWGADMVRFLAILRREGILDETGLLADPYFDRGIRIGNVKISQQAVRSIQLAKAAIAAGTEVLLEKYGISGGEIDRVVLAGGFGYYLDPRDAAEIGLLPHEMAHKAVTGGNTALSGALCIGRELLSDSWESIREKLDDYRKNTEIVNLAMEPGFEERYIRQMLFE